MINIDAEHISQEAVVLLRNKLCDLYIKYWINGIDSFSKMRIPIDLSKATLYRKIILMILQIGLIGQVIQK